MVRKSKASSERGLFLFVREREAGVEFCLCGWNSSSWCGDWYLSICNIERIHHRQHQPFSLITGYGSSVHGGELFFKLKRCTMDVPNIKALFYPRFKAPMSPSYAHRLEYMICLRNTGMVDVLVDYGCGKLVRLCFPSFDSLHLQPIVSDWHWRHLKIKMRDKLLRS